MAITRKNLTSLRGADTATSYVSVMMVSLIWIIEFFVILEKDLLIQASRLLDIASGDLAGN
jgi:hypothetical protein